ncbi:cell division cycle-associated protein 3-like [Ruditapes philippinarum]|uniref:cell division cycle-associated protein 3-like n=1 Tax=Ruditapes philippinarum TaxID=129788 RepID=UPI00295BE109|nr:cell division cycle-associated protein 3-like [Ruditapes philippinarum]
MGNSNGHEAVSVTTPKCDNNRSRILSLDPRSPSEEISRTPIVVNKTPEGALHDPLDPRSPTVGIDRTPLAPLQTAKTVPVQKVNVEMSVEDKVDHDDETEKDPLCECEDDSHVQHLPDTLGVTGIEDISLEDFPNCESTRLVPDEQMMLDMTDKVRLKKKKTKAAQPKELFPVKNAGNTKENTRSPLSTRIIDMNSPAKLVQRKQIKDLDKKMTCSQENSLSRFIVRDKENM